MFGLCCFAVSASAANVKWCVVDHVGKVSKCYVQKVNCDRHVKGRFNWQCVALQE
mgnify:FL=1